MKVKRVFAMLLTASLLLATGCTTRNNGNSSSAASLPDVASAIEDGMDDLRSGVENGVSRAEEGLSEAADELFPSAEESIPEASMESETGMSGEEPDTSLPDDVSGLESESVPAMSTDFEEIGALSADKVKWGPGLNVDADNRPTEPSLLQERYGKYGAQFIAPNSNKIYLTFDEGYENSYTADILDTLKEKNVKAVFFITYPYAQSEPELVGRMVAEGHIVGNHSTKHLSFPEMSLQAAAEDITKLHEFVKSNYGYTMSLFRPPMGEFSEQTLALVQSLGYSSVFWSFAYRDWEADNQPISIEAIDTITKRSHPGAILLLHAVSKTNAEVLGQVIDNLRGKGYEFGRFDWA